MMRFQKQLRGCVKPLIVFLFFSFFLFSISLISASSKYGNIPDFCLRYNTTEYDLWLEDYYSIDDDEEIWIRFTDPVNERVLLMPENYMTLNTECWEMAYYFTNRTPGGLTKDVIRFQTYDEDCDFDLLLRFDSDSNLNQEFNVNVREDCSINYSESPDNFNVSSSIFDDIVSFYRFDNSLYDFLNNYHSTSPNVTLYSDNSLYGFSSNLTNGNLIDFSDSINSISDTSFSLSFWYGGKGSNSETEYLLGDITNQNLGVLIGFFVGDDDYLEIKFNSTTFQNTSWDLVDGNFHHVVLVNNDSNYTLYVDNLIFKSYSFHSIAYYQLGLGIPHWQDGNNDFLFDDLGIWDRVLTPVEVSSLYNNGNGYNLEEINPSNLPNFSSIPDVNINVTDSAIVDLDDYFDGWEDIYLSALDPFNNYNYNIYTGYSTLNTDYYELTLFPNGTLNISSYNRPYSFDVTATACNYTPFEECESDTFTVNIGGNLSQVVAVNPFAAYYNLGFRDFETFAGNYHFQYYDSFVFSFPDSNYTGFLNDSYQYSVIEEPVLNASFMVYLSCNISDSRTVTNYLADLNITMECGQNNVYVTLTAYNNYNQRVYFTAYNNFSQLSDYAQILAGNYDLPTGYVAQVEDFEVNTSWYDENIQTFDSVLPTDLNARQQRQLFFLITFVAIVCSFLILFSISVTFAIYVCLIELIFFLLFFARANYISPVWFTLSIILTLLFLAIKFFRGGN